MVCPKSVWKTVFWAGINISCLEICFPNFSCFWLLLAEKRAKSLTSEEITLAGDSDAVASNITIQNYSLENKFQFTVPFNGKLVLTCLTSWDSNQHQLASQVALGRGNYQQSCQRVNVLSENAIIRDKSNMWKGFLHFH